MFRTKPSLIVLALVAIAGCKEADAPDVASTAPEPPTNAAPTSTPAANVPTAANVPAAGAPANTPAAPATANAATPPPNAPPVPAPPRRAPELPPEVLASARSGAPAVPQETPGGKDVKLVGICSYTENAVTCWNPDGGAAKALEPRVDAVLRSNSGHNGRMRYGYKNRAIVFSRPGRASVNYTGPQSDHGGMMETGRSDDPFGPGLDVVFAATFPGNPRGEIIARLQPYDRRPNTVELPLRAGAKGTVDGFPLRVVSVAKMAANDPYAGIGMHPGMNSEAAKVPKWRVSFALERGEQLASTSCEFLGADGQPIRATDATGRPKAPARPDPRMGYSGGFPAMVAQPIGGSSGTMDYALTVDPKYVKRIRFGVVRAEIAHFRDIPLDPKR